MLKEVADEFGLSTTSEIVHPAHIELAEQYIDIIQIGARNMQNFELLKEAGKASIPVLLKRGLSATLEEFVHAAEYIAVSGNSRVMLIERGIRTYEKWTRNTLDISAVPLLKLNYRTGRTHTGFDTVTVFPVNCSRPVSRSTRNKTRLFASRLAAIRWPPSGVKAK